MKKTGFGKTAALFFALLLLLSAFASCGKEKSGKIETLQDLAADGVKIGVASDTAEDRLVAKEFPQAEIEYFKDEMAAYTSVSQGKVDAFVFNRLSMQSAIRNGLKGTRLLEETLGEGNVSGAAISPLTKIPDLENRINAFLQEIKENGTLDEITDRWLVRHEEAMPPIDAPENAEITLTVGTTGMNMPFTYYIGTELAGYDVELAYRFAAYLGAKIEFKVYDYEGIVPAAQTGDVDCVFANLFITPERKEALRFSNPTFVGEIGVMVRDSAVSAPEFQTFEELNGKTVSMLTGAPFENLISSKAPNVKEFTYYTSMPDMALGIKTKKTDAGFMNNAVATLAVNRDPALALFPLSLGETSFGIGFLKGDERCAEWQAAYEKIPQSEKDALWEKWTGADETKKIMPAQDWEGKNGTVTVAACDALEPMSYVGEGGALLGLDAETILLIAKQLDVRVEFQPMDFSAALASVSSGKADIACGSIVVTAERKEAIDFVEYLPASYVLIVRSAGEAAGETSFFDSVRSSFEKTFVRESRWKLFLQGVGTTVLVTVLSVLFGTALGFGVYLLCRGGNRFANAVARFFVWLIHGMPVVVLLMILYYIIFAEAQINGTVVSVIGFTLVFGSAVFSMLKTGVGAIDKGQYEAAYALGYGSGKAFFRIILPQAAPHFMPSYKGEIVSLIKATAIVGYIAVQDLTKMGDIVRGRTYEAFFPLIAVAVIYFILAFLLTFLVRRIEIGTDPRRRKKVKILKGVKTDD